MVPVVIVGHLLHNLAIDFISEHLVFGGGLKDLVCEHDGALQLFGGVVSHIFEDGYQIIKEQPL